MAINAELFAPKPTEVNVTPVVTDGNKIATIDVNGTSTDIFAPSGGGGSSAESKKVSEYTRYRINESGDLVPESDTKNFENAEVVYTRSDAQSNPLNMYILDLSRLIGESGFIHKDGSDNAYVHGIYVCLECRVSENSYDNFYFRYSRLGGENSFQCNAGTYILGADITYLGDSEDTRYTFETYLTLDSTSITSNNAIGFESIIMSIETTF